MSHPLQQRRYRLLAALLVGLGLALWSQRVQSTISRDEPEQPRQPHGKRRCTR
jgi:hypothetical protein